MFQKKIMKTHPDLDVELKFLFEKKSLKNQRLKLNKCIHVEARGKLASELPSNELSIILHNAKS